MPTMIQQPPDLPPLPPPAVSPVQGGGGPAPAARTSTTLKPSLELWQILKARQSELTDQQESITKRRDGLVEQIQSEGNTTLRAGLEAQLGVVDKQLVQVETDLG